MNKKRIILIIILVVFAISAYFLNFYIERDFLKRIASSTDKINVVFSDPEYVNGLNNQKLDAIIKTNNIGTTTKDKTESNTTNDKSSTKRILKPGEKININTAGVEELVLLPGIGEKKAILIIEYRTANGLYKSIDELLNIKGIGQKTLDKMKPYITI